ncbi:cation:proton antiporter [Thiocapsa imhoffii]|uniref:Cation:proton antiporter n=1 Tax=Thiocapsa imhoffii TaxID=382777 RepID=A0A9X1BAI1_9GAMM|nr:monovalent cation/H+ antiporter complex subunit F [Thiocapsa imhoffii]MBK1646308.1 cation:proton antiporter [Thiocapsa imhoffii]
MITLFLLLLLPVSFLILWRFFKGPDAVNRVLAVDALTILGIALLTLVALRDGRVIYLDVALVFALVGFAGVILFGRFLDKGV